METYYAEATDTATGAELCDDNLTAAQIDFLKNAESRGIIRDLRVMRNGVDVLGMFAGSVRV